MAAPEVVAAQGSLKGITADYKGKFGCHDPETGYAYRARRGLSGDVVASISAEQLEALAAIFPEFPRDRAVLSHNGYNQQVFRVLPGVHDNRAEVLAGFTTQPPEGHGTPVPVAPPDGFDAVVAFCGKFADWKRLDALLRAAAIYEQHDRKILTLVIGSGPHEAQVQMHDLAAEQPAIDRSEAALAALAEG